MAKTFVLSDDSVNSYGFRIDMDNLDIERFKANPVMLYNHGELIGRWTNIRLENGRLLAEPEFMESEGEPLAAQTKERVEKDFLKGASVGLHIISHEVKDDEPATVTAEVCECSIVDIPSNANAIALYDKAGIKLEGEAVQLALIPLTKQTQKPIETEMKLNADSYKALGLQEGAGASEVDAAIKKLAADLTKLQQERKEEKEKRISSLVETALDQGRITKDEKEDFEQLAAANFALAEKTINAREAKESLAGKEKLSGKGTGDAGERSDWTFEKWRKEDTPGLLKIKKEDPERYAELQKK